jgi:hypothetical protein
MCCVQARRSCDACLNFRKQDLQHEGRKERQRFVPLQPRRSATSRAPTGSANSISTARHTRRQCLRRPGSRLCRARHTSYRSSSAIRRTARRQATSCSPSMNLHSADQLPDRAARYGAAAHHAFALSRRRHDRRARQGAGRCLGAARPVVREPGARADERVDLDGILKARVSQYRQCSANRCKKSQY